MNSKLTGARLTDEQRTAILKAWQIFEGSLKRVEQLEEPGEYEYDPTDGIDPWEDEEQEMEDAEKPGCPYKSECYGYYNTCKEHLCTQADMDEVDDDLLPDTPMMKVWLLRWKTLEARKVFCNINLPKKNQSAASAPPVLTEPVLSASSGLSTPSEQPEPLNDISSTYQIRRGKKTWCDVSEVGSALGYVWPKKSMNRIIQAHMGGAQRKPVDA